jgi:hypothetical protein
VTTPIRRGTARRLGITQPDPVVTVYINPDLSGFTRSMHLVLLAKETHWAVQDAFRRLISTIDTAGPEETG